jgi:DNA-binding LacI/PurR family transcriptional regulator
MAAWPAYSLTTVQQPIDWMVDATIERLMRAIQSPVAEIVIKKVPGILVERNSARTVINDNETWKGRSRH